MDSKPRKATEGIGGLFFCDTSGNDLFWLRLVIPAPVINPLLLVLVWMGLPEESRSAPQ